MGTSGAYGGSGGRDWSAARDAAAELIATPGDQGKQESALADLADALDWDGDAPEADGEQPGDEAEEDGARPRPQPAAPPFPRLTQPRGRGDGPGGGAGGSGGGGGLGPGGRGRRSRMRTANIGGAVLAAGLAVRQGDAATLGTLGLSLAELAEVSPLAQCSRILDALVGSGADIDESEIRAASSAALVAILTEDAGPAQAVRLFIVEYVMEVAVTELGASLRADGAGEVSIQVEDELRSLVIARTDRLELDGERLGPDELQNAVYKTLGVVRQVLEAMRE
jgi:hypothetical protein